MNEQQSDFEWLRQFARAENQEAFRQIVRRHIDLVFATALRKTGDAGSAEEISQNVFGVLARKAWQFAPDDSLPAWLYKTTLLESQSWLRGELRRRRREQTAAELGTTMKTQNEPAAFAALLPLLDEALLSLREKDRTVLLLRFYEKQSLRNVGDRLGVSEDTAQKRVATALEKLSQFFHRRGYRTATVAATAAALQHTTTSATAATTALVLDAALKGAPPALAAFGTVLARFASFSKVQTAIVCAMVAVVPLIWRGNQIHDLAGASPALQAKIAALQADRIGSEQELIKLRGLSAQLDQKQVEAVQNQTHTREGTRKLQELRARSRSLLAADNYRWPEDLPFVRVPKSALGAVQLDGGPVSPDKLAFKIEQFLDLTTRERELTAQIFTNYSAEINQLVETTVYQTNHAATISLPPAAESTVFVLPPLGPKIRGALTRLGASLEAALGSERWAMVKPNDFEFTDAEQVRLLGYTKYNWDQPQEMAVNIFPHPGGEPTFSWAADHGIGCSPRPLRDFPDYPRSAFMMQLGQGPPALLDRVYQYCVAEAKTRFPATSAK